VPAILINSPERMSRVRVIALKDDAPETLKSLQQLGVLHVETSTELRPVDRAALEAGQAEVRDLLALVEGLLGYAPKGTTVALGADIEVIFIRPYSEIRDEIRSTHSRASLLHERITALGAEAENLRVTVGALSPLAQVLTIGVADLNFSGDCIASRAALLPVDALAGAQEAIGDRILQSVAARTTEGDVFYAVVRTTHLAALEMAVKDAGGRMLAPRDGKESLGEYLASSSQRITALEAEAAGLRTEIEALVRSDLKRLALLREALVSERDRLSVLAKAAEADYVSLVEGWVPERDVAEAMAGMREKTPQAFVDARKPEPGESPPTKLKNPRLMRPFEQIVKIVDIPKYGGWDPTPIVAFSFAFFYGLMLSDVLYGICLFLLAKFLLPFFVEDRYEEGFKEFQRLIYLCSGSVILFGALNGSWMGNIQTLVGLKDVALSPLVARLMGDPLSFVIMAVIIGFLHVNLAHLLALIKGIGDRNLGVILNRVGLFLTQFGLPGLLSGMLNVQIPLIPVAAYPYLTYVMYGGIVVVVASNYLMNKGTGFFLWIFDITGLFGDVVSYARLAGVGLATFYLGQSFNLIVVLFGKIFPGVFGAIVGTVAGIVLFLIGHTFNLILGGMGCFVHSLRLCFVEFLTKFFDGGGQEYEPFRIRRRPVVAVAVKS
jgi:V/A-type H+-transporting ATPase subunit I